MGTLRLLEAIRLLGLDSKTRFYRHPPRTLRTGAETPQTETTRFTPAAPTRSPIVMAAGSPSTYRGAYGMYACNRISSTTRARGAWRPSSPQDHRGLANIAQGLERCLFMGNLDALRDWGHARDYVRMQWMMLQQDTAEDFVIATGQRIRCASSSWSAAELGVTLRFEGDGVEGAGDCRRHQGELAPALKIGDVIVRVDPRLLPPAGSRDPARQSIEGPRKARLDAGNHRPARCAPR